MNENELRSQGGITHGRIQLDAWVFPGIPNYFERKK
jgi:hypothetical protein